jgi:hypothetical protein
MINLNTDVLVIQNYTRKHFLAVLQKVPIEALPRIRHLGFELPQQPGSTGKDAPRVQHDPNFASAKACPKAPRQLFPKLVLITPILNLPQADSTHIKAPLQPLEERYRHFVNQSDK